MFKSSIISDPYHSPRYYKIVLIGHQCSSKKLLRYILSGNQKQSMLEKSQTVVHQASFVNTSKVNLIIKEIATNSSNQNLDIIDDQARKIVLLFDPSIKQTYQYLTKKTIRSINYLFVVLQKSTDRSERLIKIPILIFINKQNRLQYTKQQKLKLKHLKQLITKLKWQHKKIYDFSIKINKQITQQSIDCIIQNIFDFLEQSQIDQIKLNSKTKKLKIQQNQILLDSRSIPSQKDYSNLIPQNNCCWGLFKIW